MAEVLVSICVAVVAAVFGAISYQKRKTAEARNQYLTEVLRRREKYEQTKQAHAAEERAAVVEIEAAVAARREATAVERAEVASASRRVGKAQAAVEHIRRVTKRIVIFALLPAFVGQRVRAEECPPGETLMKGERAACDWECLPSDVLDSYVARSMELEECKADLLREQVLRPRVLRLEKDLMACETELAAIPTLHTPPVTTESGWSWGTWTVVVISAAVLGFGTGYVVSEISK